MHQYRVYVIGLDGRFIKSIDLSCADDSAAIEAPNNSSTATTSSFGSRTAKWRGSVASRSKAMRPRKNKPWTDDDSERLKVLVASGTSPLRAAAIFDIKPLPVTVGNQRAAEWPVKRKGFA